MEVGFQGYFEGVEGDGGEVFWGGGFVGAGGEEGIGDEVFGVWGVGDFAFSVFEEF